MSANIDEKHAEQMDKPLLSLDEKIPLFEQRSMSSGTSSGNEEQNKKIYERILENSDSKDERPVCVLVLDGGGLRGVLTCRILKELEKQLNKESDGSIKIGDVFDVVMGTSTGGLISLGLGRLHWNVDDCINLYHKMAVEVFGYHEHKSNSWYGKIMEKSYDGMLSAWHSVKFVGSTVIRGAISMYSSTIFEQVLKDQMNLSKDYNADLDLLISKEQYDKQKQALVACIATDVTIPDNAYPVLLRSYTLNSKTITEIPNYPGTCHGKVLRAAMCTSAAPTYFDQQTYEIPHPDKHKRKHTLVDGGLNANFPSVIAYCESQLLWPKRKIFMVSIGTGQEKIDWDEMDEGAFASVKGIIQNAFGSFFSAKEVAAMCTISTLAQLGDLDIVRFNPTIDKDKTAMDKPSLMDYWESRGNEYAEKHQWELEAIAKILLNCQKSNILDEAQM